MIYVELCIQKRIFKPFRGVFYLGDRPPKIPMFSGSDPERLEREPQYSSRQNNLKKLTYLCSSASGLRYQSEKCPLIPIPAVPNQKKQKSAVFACFGTVFNQIVGALRFSIWAVISSAYPPVQTQNWKHTWGFLKNMPTIWDIGAFLRIFQGTIRKIGEFLGGKFGI